LSVDNEIIEIQGKWIPVDIDIAMVEENDKHQRVLNHTMTKLKVFATHQLLENFPQNILGISPCPQSLSDYSLYYKLGQDIGSIVSIKF